MTWWDDKFKDLFIIRKEVEKKAYSGKGQIVFTQSDIKEGIADIDTDPKTVNRNIALLYPYVRKHAEALVSKARHAGLRVDLFEGARSWERSDYLFRVAKTTKAKGGRSWHNYRLACDIVFKDDRNQWSWLDKWDWKTLGQFGLNEGFIWGGSWGWDKAHFEWHPMFKSWRDALSLYKSGGIKSVFACCDDWCKQNGIK